MKPWKFKNTQAKAKNDGKYKNINNKTSGKITFGLCRYTWRILYIRVLWFCDLSATPKRNPVDKQRRQSHKEHGLQGTIVYGLYVCLGVRIRIYVYIFFFDFFLLLPHLANDTRQKPRHICIVTPALTNTLTHTHALQVRD